jgi:hypothetical protein
MADRADHYRWADELVWRARRHVVDHSVGGRQFDGLDGPDWQRVMADLAAAQVHATLAAAGPGVEQAVNDQAKRAARAVGAAESVEDRAPLSYGICPTPGLGQPGPHDDRPRPHPPTPTDDPGHPK